MTARCDPVSGSTPPTTDVPPPNGTTAMPLRIAHGEHGEDFGVGGGGHHGIGGRLRVIEAATQQVGCALAAEMQHPDAVVPGDAGRLRRLR